MNETYQALRLILKQHEAKLDVVKDLDSEYTLNSRITEKGKPIFFGMVKASKTKVAFHLMPVYCHPDLLETISDDLRKRMQGKSCFNFSKVDKALFAELQLLTNQGFEVFQSDGRI